MRADNDNCRTRDIFRRAGSTLVQFGFHLVDEDLSLYRRSTPDGIACVSLFLNAKRQALMAFDLVTPERLAQGAPAADMHFKEESALPATLLFGVATREEFERYLGLLTARTRARRADGLGEGVLGRLARRGHLSVVLTPGT